MPGLEQAWQFVMAIKACEVFWMSLGTTYRLGHELHAKLGKNHVGTETIVWLQKP